MKDSTHNHPVHIAPAQAGKLASLSRLCATIAHELGNPLIGVSYLLDDLSNRSGLAAEDRDLLTSGLQECQRMKDYLKNLNESCQPPTGIPEPLDLTTITGDVLDQWAQACATVGVIVATEFGADLPVVEGDRRLVRKVIDALVQNGVEAMRRSGGSLLVKTLRCGDDAIVEISDTGGGIAPQWCETIFDPLFSTKEDPTNRGLGLTAAACIVQEYGGTIGFSTEHGCGSTFILTLPGTAESGR